MDLGPHASYIISAYVGVALLTLFLVFSAFAGARRQQNRLDALEAKGIRRRSDTKAE